MRSFDDRDPIVWLIALAVILAFFVGCAPVPEVKTEEPSIKLLTYDELGDGLNVSIIELVDTEEQFIVVRSYQNSIAIHPLERSRDVQRISEEQSEERDDGDSGGSN
jgi:uncharacterized lipoprotein YajG